MFKDRYNFQNNQPLINFMIYDSNCTGNCLQRVTSLQVISPHKPTF